MTKKNESGEESFKLRHVIDTGNIPFDKMVSDFIHRIKSVSPDETEKMVLSRIKEIRDQKKSDYRIKTNNDKLPCVCLGKLIEKAAGTKDTEEDMALLKSLQELYSKISTGIAYVLEDKEKLETEIDFEFISTSLTSFLSNDTDSKLFSNVLVNNFEKISNVKWQVSHLRKALDKIQDQDSKTLNKLLEIDSVRALDWAAHHLEKALNKIQDEDSKTLNRLLEIDSVRALNWDACHLGKALHKMLNGDSKTLSKLLEIDSVRALNWDACHLGKALYNIQNRDSETLSKLLEIDSVRALDWDVRHLGKVLYKVRYGDSETLNNLLKIDSVSKIPWDDQHVEVFLDRIAKNDQVTLDKLLKIIGKDYSFSQKALHSLSQCLPEEYDPPAYNSL